MSAQNNSYMNQSINHLINFMKTFIDEAKKYDFPLPSYDFIYQLFSEGSERIHQGKIHTAFEIQEAIRTVSNFIDELETIEITREKMDEFAINCKCVRI